MQDPNNGQTPPPRRSPRTQVERFARGPALRRRHARALQPPRVQAQPLRVLLNVVEPAVLQAAARDECKWGCNKLGKESQQGIGVQWNGWVPPETARKRDSRSRTSRELSEQPSD
jgi:hypothetical protein